MSEEAMEEFALASAEAAYEDPGEQALIIFMNAGGESHEARNASYWWDCKLPSFPRQTFSENTNWEAMAVHMSVAEESIRKADGRVSDPLDWWGCINYPRYNAERLHTYRNCSNKMEPEMAERAKHPTQ